MLVLTRKVGERVVIGSNVELVIQRLSSGRVVLGLEAPANIQIRRHELPSVPDRTGQNSADTKRKSPR